eukprot:CAMPEP_0170645176 /NCGR_PEP_ID=MMETSP0224-20130122/42921_1 /TAXON_ID=285029 /ORGANISM="Togula jolla, Strain CCCM 725" /LENGTH=588 /DNA_ID=CAMNT_0010976337 /DNA_START=44 /DNA_END=1810 /DNA_ORIENTATION=-
MKALFLAVVATACCFPAGNAFVARAVMEALSAGHKTQDLDHKDKALIDSLRDEGLSAKDDKEGKEEKEDKKDKEGKEDKEEKEDKKDKEDKEDKEDKNDKEDKGDKMDKEDKADKCSSKCIGGKNADSPWEQKCGWKDCRGCDECLPLEAHVPMCETPYEYLQCKDAVLTTSYMDSADYDRVEKLIIDAMAHLPDACNGTYCPQADVTGCILRIAGHDFMDYDPETLMGGSDGCIDLAHSDNRGLDECLMVGTEHGFDLYSYYKYVCSQISLADFIVIAAEAVMRFTRELYLIEYPDRARMDFKGQFMYGRTTAKMCPESASLLPHAEECSDVERVFVDNLNLDWPQAAALMGVHSLGRAVPENSGYDGWWSDPENSRYFNNNYFVSLLANGWMPERNLYGNPHKNQWTNANLLFNQTEGGKQMMLDTDLCLAFSTGKLWPTGTLRAASDDCCSWTMVANIQEAITSYNDGKFCDVDDPETIEVWNSLPTGRAANDFRDLWDQWGEDTGLNPNKTFKDGRAACCMGQRSFKDEFANYTDCGGVSHPTGVAHVPVTKFANDEDYWIEIFMQAWHKATRRGFEGALKSLS